MSKSRQQQAALASAAGRRWCARIALAVTIVCGLAIAIAAPASAQVVVVVNGEPITALDVAQRIKLTEVATHKIPSRQEALDDLIDEKLKLQIAKRYVVDITEKDVNATLAGMAQRAGFATEQFTKVLAQSGISVAAFKDHIKADMGWNAIVRGKFMSSLQVGEKDVREALQSRKKDDKTSIAYLYTLRQVLFIAPRGVPDNILEARRREAEGLRARFLNCEEGSAIARALKDVAVRNPINRLSSEVPAKQREVVDTTPVGRLTPPEVTQLGVEMFAVCAKQEVHGDSPDAREVRDQITNQRYQAQSKRYLQQLRRNAMIEVR
jgi:peptidyl-prolyl cis-trans isomerase SurA